MFARSILVISLGCILSSTIHAENTASQALEPIPPSSEIPIESYPLTQSREAASAPVEADPPQLSTPVQSASEEEATPAIPSPAAPVAKNTTSQTAQTAHVTTAAKVEWTLDALNNAEWTEGLTRGQLPIYAKAQVLLNRKHASPGAIDGTTGMNTLKAISTYQTMNNLNADGVLTLDTWQSLNSQQSDPVFIEYTITEDDLKGPFAKSIPSNYAEQAKMKGLYYTRVTELLGEKFHMDENFLKQINPKATFNKAGEKIIVANIRNDLPADIHLIIAHKGAKQLYLFNSKNKMIASFPATIGSSSTPSPTGTHTIKNIAPNPWYGYHPKNFVQGGNMKPLSLPPGPNNPVGNMWIGLSKPSFGIHGTPNPSTISKTASHGCIRLTNWDANDLAKRVKPGITVKFIE